MTDREDDVERQSARASSDNELVELLGPFWTSARVSTALGIPVNDLVEAQVSGALLGLQSDDGLVTYPVWQFHRLAGGRVEVRPPLAAMFRELVECDPWAVAVLINTPAPELGGQTPLDAVRSGTAPGPRQTPWSSWRASPHANGPASLGK